MFRRFAFVCGVAIGAVSTAACQEKASAVSSGALADVCSALGASYVIPGDPPDHGQIKRKNMLRKLVSADELERMDGARRLLSHSECHTSAIVEAAIRESGESGDPRVFADLAEIVTERGYVGDPCRGADGDGNNGHGNDPDHDDSADP